MKEKITKIVKSRLFTLAKILLFIAICIGVGSAGAFFQHKTDPTNQAVAYFRAFVKRDYDKMYSYLGTNKGYYISKDMYKAVIKKNRENLVIDSYKIDKPEKVDGQKQVTIKCTNENTQKSSDFVIRFMKKRKLLQIIPDYYVDIDNMLVKDFSIIIKKGNELELNGDVITDKTADISTDDKGNIVYKIKGIINGQYRVSATNKYYASTKSINLVKKDTKVDLTGNNYTANGKYTKLIVENGKNVIDRFYKSVRKRKSSDKKLLSYFDNNKKLLNKVKDAVKKSQEVVYWTDKKNIDAYNVIEMKMSTPVCVIKYDTAKKKYQASFTYSYDYTSSTDTALYTSYVYKLSGKCNTVMNLTYTLRDDNIVITDISVSNKNKKNGD